MHPDMNFSTQQVQSPSAQTPQSRTQPTASGSFIEKNRQLLIGALIIGGIYFGRQHLFGPAAADDSPVEVTPGQAAPELAPQQSSPAGDPHSYSADPHSSPPGHGAQSAPGQRVEAYGATYFDVQIVAGHLAEVVVVGDGDTDLDLFIYDPFGNLVASDTDLTDVCLCQWNPQQTGVFRIVVQNLGGVYNVFDIEVH